MKLIREDELVQTLGLQFRLNTARIDPYAVPEDVLRLIPKEVAQANDIFPLGLGPSGTLRVAVFKPLTGPELRRLEEAVGHPLDMVLSSKSDISFALRRGYERLEDREAEGPPPLGERLVNGCVITPDQLDEALKTQRSGYTRLGDVLVGQGALTGSQLAQAVAEYFRDQAPAGRFGAFLVERGSVTQAQLDEALRVQAEQARFLGDILADMGVSAKDITTVVAGGRPDRC